MKTKVLQENLSKALTVASRFINTKAQLPILGNILFSATKTKLTVSSTNLEISTSVSIGAQSEEEGEITVPGKIVSETVSNLPLGTVVLEAEKEQLKIKTDSFSANILGMNPSDFPSIPHSAPAKDATILSQKEFAEALALVIYAASIDETRPTLTGVLMIFDKNHLTAVATDGFRLSQKKIRLVNEQKGLRLILPKNALVEAQRIFQGEGDLVFAFSQAEKQVVFEGQETVLSSRIIEGEFPNFEKIIPNESSVKINLDKEDFLRAVNLASVFARESANIVKIQIVKDSMKISAESSSAGSQETEVEAKVEGEEMEIVFNFRFLEEFLRSAKGEDIEISLSGPSAPAVFTDPSDPDFLHLIMPVRIQG